MWTTTINEEVVIRLDAETGLTDVVATFYDDDSVDVHTSVMTEVIEGEGVYEVRYTPLSLGNYTIIVKSESLGLSDKMPLKVVSEAANAAAIAASVRAEIERSGGNLQEIYTRLGLEAGNPFTSGVDLFKDQSGAIEMDVTENVTGVGSDGVPETETTVTRR